MPNLIADAKTLGGLMLRLTTQIAEPELSAQTLLAVQECFPKTPLVVSVTLFWVEKPHRPHAACASAEYVSEGKIGVHLELPVPVGTAIWIVLANGSGFQGIVSRCDTVSGGHLAEVRLTAR